MSTVEPFNEVELEDTNNFYFWFAPWKKEVIPGPSCQRGLIEWLSKKNPKRDVPHRNHYTDDNSGYSDLFLDQTPMQVLSAVEKTIADVCGSFNTAQEIYCRWDKNKDNQDSKKKWREVHDKVYRALREKGYAPRELCL